MRVIEVGPLGEGWRVAVTGLANDLLFHSGHKAEAAARRLARRLALAGAASEIRIRLRDGSLGGRFLCPATPSAPVEQPIGVAA